MENLPSIFSVTLGQSAPSQLPNCQYWVPCVLNQISGSFLPLYNQSNYPFQADNPVPQRLRGQAKINRGGICLKAWKQEEDEKLISLVNELGKKQWTNISNIMNEMFEESQRMPKHCRERWINYLDPGLNSNR